MKRPYGIRDQSGLARERESEALEADQKKESEVAVGSSQDPTDSTACLFRRFLPSAVGEPQFLRSVHGAIREVRSQAGIREIERVRVFLVEFGDRVQPVHDRGIAHLD